MQLCVILFCCWICERLDGLQQAENEWRQDGDYAKLESVPQTSSLTLSGSAIPFSYKVRNLGVCLDSNFSMDQHVSLLCRFVFLELHRMGHLRHHLTVDVTKKLVSSFILSWLDYCNSLLAGLTENRLDHLQGVQNNAAHLVLGRQGQDHATPLLRSLLWLPVQPWTEYMISTLCYRCRDSSAPAYLNLIFSRSTFPLSAFCRCWSHDCSMPQTQQVWKACFLIHRTCDLEFPPQTSAWCLKSPLLQIQSENIPLQKASVLMTFTVRPTRVLNKADSFLYICIFCVMRVVCIQLFIICHVGSGRAFWPKGGIFKLM